MNIVRPTTLEGLLVDCKQKIETPDDIEILLGHEVMLDIARRVLALEAE